MVFELIKETEYEAVFSLKADEKTKEWYPFDFELHLTYTLMDLELIIRYNVMNNGSHAMYFSIGGHPAFALPNQFERYSLKFEPNEKLISYPLENDLISNATKEIDLIQSSVPLTYSLFENDALIFKELQSNQIKYNYLKIIRLS
jgi:galactose mutarotase-like enzyme